MRGWVHVSSEGIDYANDASVGDRHIAAELLHSKG